MFCTKCSSQNPDDAKYCYHCGKALFRSSSPTIVAVGPTPRDPDVGSSPTQPLAPPRPLPIAYPPAASDSRVPFYGGFSICIGAVVAVVAFTVDTGGYSQEVKVPVFIVQAILLIWAGAAILQHSTYARTLLWVTVGFTSLGLLLSGVTLLFLLLWIANLTLAILYSGHVKNSSKHSIVIARQQEPLVPGRTPPASTTQPQAVPEPLQMRTPSPPSAEEHPWGSELALAAKPVSMAASPNKRPSIVLWVGALIIAVMALYPPWKYVCSKYSIEKIGPYEFVFSPPEIPGKVSSDPLSFIRSGLRDLELEKEGLDFDKYPRDMWTVQVDWYRFILPVGAVGFLTIALTLTFRVRSSVKE